VPPRLGAGSVAPRRRERHCEGGCGVGELRADTGAGEGGMPYAIIKGAIERKESLTGKYGISARTCWATIATATRR
jgi:hypothetical protein